MAWQPRSNRAVPNDWRERRALVLHRDRGICYACGHDGATEVDHLLNVTAGGTHDLANLAAIHGAPCSTCGRKCHNEKTQAEARAARVTMRRPAERHPGLI